MKSKNRPPQHGRIPYDLAILTRLFQPSGRALSRAAARALLRFRFSDGDMERVNALSEKARRGTLSPEESQEMDSYERVSHLLAILQSNARKSLRRRPAS